MAEMMFHQRFDRHGQWRRDLALRLRLLDEWLGERELLEPAVQERLAELQAQLRSDKVMVAFVAEFSRGKSELINAIFFAGYGRRIMPASAGRTTMCPTELGYDPEIAPCLRLLPIETRLQPQALMEWRMAPEQWTRVDLDVNDAEQLSLALAKVAETRHVSIDEARALGFWHDDAPEDNPLPDAAGRVEVPRWRHALINVAHPLLRQGLVVLDTPGLNAVGAEPELTVNLIPQAQAAVFILGADTGVTKSDLAIWREHLATQTDGEAARLVVLNKIDALWDGLSTPEQVRAQIERQRESVAGMLGVQQDQVLAVSAQKGLLAKVTGDDALLARSQLPQLEEALAHKLLARRQQILRAATHAGVSKVREEVWRLLDVRRRDLLEQRQELEGLRGKNLAVIRQMRLRIDSERSEFDAAAPRVLAMRSIHMKLLQDIDAVLGTAALKEDLIELRSALRQSGIKFGVRKAYAATFARLHEAVDRVQTLQQEILAMLTAAFQRLNAEFGFSLQLPLAPDLARAHAELEAVEHSHVQYLSLGNALRLAQPEFAQRLVRALGTRVRVIYESLQTEVESWNKSALAQVDTQLRERRRQFRRRREAVERIEEAAGGLEARLAELAAQEAALRAIGEELDALVDAFADAPAPDLAPTPAQARRA